MSSSAALHGAHFEATLHGAWERATPRWEQYTGLTHGAWLGSGWLAAVHAEDRTAAFNHFATSAAAGESYEREVRLRRSSDGAFRWHALRAVLVRDTGACGARWLGACTDVHARRRAEDAARFLAEASTSLDDSLDYQTILDRFAALAVPRLADAWELLSADDASPPRGPAARALRDGRAALVHAPDASWLDALAGNDVRGQRFVAFAPRAALLLPLVARGRTLGIAVLFACRPELEYDDGTLYEAADLAHRAALALDNARLHDAAQRAVQAREEFVSIASHELKTPLTSLLVGVQLARQLVSSERRSPARAARLAQSLESAERQSKRLRGLIDDLLDVAQMRNEALSLHRTSTDLREVLHAVVTRAARELERAGCAVSLDARLPVIGYWDRARLEQVATNFLTNAIKYGGGAVRITLAATPERARLVFADRGIGIAAEELPRIFDRFARAASVRHREGLGLGLYIVKRIVDAHGGTVDVASVLGDGTSFEVTLPR